MKNNGKITNKLIIILIVVASIFAIYIKANAASTVGSASIGYTVNNNANIGDEITAKVNVNNVNVDSNNIGICGVGGNISFDSDYLEFISATGMSSPYAVSVNKNNNYKFAGIDFTLSNGFSSATDIITLKFKTLKTGSTTLSLANVLLNDCNNNKLSVTPVSKTITIGTPVIKDSNNYLSALSIIGYTISPAFNKNTTSYSLTVPNNVSSVTLNATKESAKATLTGTGNKSLSVGANNISVVVTAENGSTRTYIINATVKEKDPINVKVDGKNYSVVRKLDRLKVPQTFNEKDVTINDETIKGCYNESLDYTLVALKDENNNIRFYIYNEGKNTYSKFNMISSADLNVIVLKLEDKDDIPYRYSKTVFNYNDDSIDGYSYGNTDFKVIYGINAVTGEEGLYQYDTKDNTIQRFFNEQTNLYINLVQKIKLVFIILGSVILIFTIIIIILLSKNVKFKKKYLNNRLNEIDDPNYNKIRYEDIEENNEDLEEELSKKELKKLKKDKKRKEKSEKTFLDE